MLNKHTIKTAANAREKREPQSVPVNISPFAARWRCFHTHTHSQWWSVRGEDAHKSWFNDVLKSYLHMQRAQNFSEHQRKLASRFSARATLANIWPAPLWAILNRWFGRRRRRWLGGERERGGKERGASVGSWKVAGAWWAAWLPAWVVIWRVRESRDKPN